MSSVGPEVNALNKSSIVGSFARLPTRTYMAFYMQARTPLSSICAETWLCSLKILQFCSIQIARFHNSLILLLLHPRFHGMIKSLALFGIIHWSPSFLSRTPHTSWAKSHYTRMWLIVTSLFIQREHPLGKAIPRFWRLSKVRMSFIASCYNPSIAWNFRVQSVCPNLIP